MNVKWFMQDDFACGYVRAEVPAREINKDNGSCRIDCKGKVYISDYPNTHIMVFQRSHSVDLLEKMIFAKKLGIKTVYELDDDLLNTPKEFIEPYKLYSDPRIQSNIVSFMNEADAVMVSTEVMAKRVREEACNVPIHIVENYLDVERWDNSYAEKQTILKDNITIGYMGSGSHAHDMPLVTDSIYDIMEKYDNTELLLIGWVGWEQLGKKFQKFEDRITTIEWVPIDVLPDSMKNIDIGIAPLLINKFNKCKSAIKIFQYWALGIAPVVSAIDEYSDKIEDNVDGFLVHNKNEWYDHIEKLVLENDFRRIMGAHGRRKLLSKYDIRNNANRLVNTFVKILTS